MRPTAPATRSTTRAGQPLKRVEQSTLNRPQRPVGKQLSPGKAAGASAAPVPTRRALSKPGHPAATAGASRRGNSESVRSIDVPDVYSEEIKLLLLSLPEGVPPLYSGSAREKREKHIELIDSYRTAVITAFETLHEGCRILGDKMSEIRTIDDNIKRIDSQRDELGRNTAFTQTSIERLNKRLPELQNDFNNLADTSKSLEVQVARYRTQNETVQGSLDQLQGEYDRTKLLLEAETQYSEKIQDEAALLEAKAQELQQSIEKTDFELHQLETDPTQHYDARIAELTAKRSELSDRHHALAKSLAALEHTHSRLTREVAELEARLDDQRNGCGEIQSTLKQQRDESVKLQSILDDITASLDSLQSAEQNKQLKELKHEYNLLEIELNPLTTKIQELSTLVAKREDAVSLSNSLLADLTSEISRLRDSLFALDIEHREKMDRYKQDAKKQLDELNSKIQTITKSHREEVHQLVTTFNGKRYELVTEQELSAKTVQLTMDDHARTETNHNELRRKAIEREADERVRKEMLEMSGPMLQHKMDDLHREIAAKRRAIEQLQSEQGEYDDSALLERRRKISRSRALCADMEQQIVKLDGTTELQEIKKPQRTPPTATPSTSVSSSSSSPAQAAPEAGSPSPSPSSTSSTSSSSTSSSPPGVNQQSSSVLSAAPPPTVSMHNGGAVGIPPARRTTLDRKRPSQACNGAPPRPSVSNAVLRSSISSTTSSSRATIAHTATNGNVPSNSTSNSNSNGNGASTSSRKPVPSYMRQTISSMRR